MSRSSSPWTHCSVAPARSDYLCRGTEEWCSVPGVLGRATAIGGLQSAPWAMRINTGTAEKGAAYLSATGMKATAQKYGVPVKGPCSRPVVCHKRHGPQETIQRVLTPTVPDTHSMTGVQEPCVWLTIFDGQFQHINCS